MTTTLITKIVPRLVTRDVNGYPDCWSIDCASGSSSSVTSSPNQASSSTSSVELLPSESILVLAEAFESYPDWSSCAACPTHSSGSLLHPSKYVPSSTFQTYAYSNSYGGNTSHLVIWINIPKSVEALAGHWVSIPGKCNAIYSEWMIPHSYYKDPANTRLRTILPKTTDCMPVFMASEDWTNV